MRRVGNGNPDTCVANLMSMTIGECPFDRLRGRDPAMLDRPMGEKQAIRNAKMVVEMYEPRVNANVVQAKYTDKHGNFEIVMDVERMDA